MAVLPARSWIERALSVSGARFGCDREMSGKKSVEPSPASVARTERQRLAQEEGARAMADVERRAVEVRQNMKRLRALREAKEAIEDEARPLSQPGKKRRSRRIAR